MDMYQKRKIRKENKNEDKQLHSVPINCEEWANAKLPKSVQK